MPRVASLVCPVHSETKVAYTGKRDGLIHDCLSCARERSKRYWNNKGKARRKTAAFKKAQRTTRVKWQFGLSEQAYRDLLIGQGSCCAICKVPDSGQRSWHIDHDHTCCPGKKSCGKCVRGLLCSNCNVGLGHFKDDSDRLFRAQCYLVPKPIGTVFELRKAA